VSGCDLNGLGVLVTRPSGQAASLAASIQQMGGKPTLFPGVQIKTADPAKLASALSPLAAVDLAVFVSPTAVRAGVPALIEKFGSLDGVRLAAVGRSTAAELKTLGLTDVIVPDGPGGGEALAGCPQLGRMANRTVLVVRGERGNEALGTILKERGAVVSFLECYRRCLPEADFSGVGPLLRDGRIGAWMATSGEILDNLLRLAGEQAALLRNTPLFVNHPQIAVRAFSQAVKVIFVTAGGDAGLCAGLGTWFCGLRTSMS
jgi:uroporphyrinogen-III synthase